MFWYAFSVFLFLVAIALLVFIRLRDRKYEKRTIYETMRENLREEVDIETEEAHKRSEKFRKELNLAARPETRDPRQPDD